MNGQFLCCNLRGGGEVQPKFFVSQQTRTRYQTLEGIVDQIAHHASAHVAATPIFEYLVNFWHNYNKSYILLKTNIFGALLLARDLLNSYIKVSFRLNKIWLSY